jgi:arylformamidase
MDRVRAIDLTHPLWDDMMVFPGLRQPEFRAIANVPADGYAMSEYHLLNHIGTHIDAPSHMEADGVTLDEIPLERLVTDAVVIDVSGHAPGPISRLELEPLAGDVRAGDFVLFYSDNGRNYGHEAYNTGWTYPDADAARLLIERGVSGVGFDGPSADAIDSTAYELHHVWLGAGRLILENLTNLGELPARTPIVIAPMKVREANGAPARVFALVGA